MQRAVNVIKAQLLFRSTVVVILILLLLFLVLLFGLLDRVWTTIVLFKMQIHIPINNA